MLNTPSYLHQLTWCWTAHGWRRWRRKQPRACRQRFGRRGAAHTHHNERCMSKAVVVRMSPGPLRRTRAERWRSLSSSVQAAVYSCYLHGFCTNGLEDLGFVLLVLWPGMVANGRPWGRHPPGGRRRPAAHALASTSTIQSAHTPTHHATDDTQDTRPLPVGCTPRAAVMRACCSLKGAGA